MILNEQITPAEGEQCVKTYHCTSFRSRLLSIASEGYLEVTNKRVIFQATGGDSIIHSEVPIEDVSGISVFKGSYFSIMHLLGALVLGVLVGGLVGGFVTLLGLSGAGTILAWVVALALLAGGIFIQRRNILRPIFAVASAISFTAMIGAGALGAFSALGGFGRSSAFAGAASGVSAVLASLAAMVVGIYAVVCLVWYATRKTMSLAVNSKGGSQTPIAIAGAGGSSIIYSSAARALEAEPAQDAEAVSRELGALVMDIQQRGDAMIEKWQPGSTS
jgi:hypothetical protein